MRADMGRRYRLYPASEQEQVLTRWGHTVRALWNVALEQRVHMWEQRRYTLRSIEQCTHLTIARAELPWLAELPAQAAQQVLRHLDRAYDNFWNPDHPAGFPQRRKRGHQTSVSFPGQIVEIHKLNRHWAVVKIPKLGWVPAAPNGRPGCGVDFGVTSSAYVSTDDAPRLKPAGLAESEKQRLLALEQRKARQIAFAKKYNGGEYGNRLRSTIASIGKLKTREANRRQDFTHQLTTDLAKNHGFVGIEDLRVPNLTASARGTREQPGRNVAQKAGLNRSILDNCPGERRQQLAYKCDLYGSRLITVPAFHTSQTCAACGQVDPESRKGCGRLFACVHCGHEDDADHNASVEIEARARRTGGSVINSTRRRPGRRVPPSGGGGCVKPSQPPSGSPRESLGTHRERIVKTTRSSPTALP
ncbi:RNA-guided endonuclease InsQ/TnpB family protein [Streptomyces sp. NPDC055092]